MSEELKLKFDQCERNGGRELNGYCVCCCKTDSLLDEIEIEVEKLLKTRANNSLDHIPHVGKKVDVNITDAFENLSNMLDAIIDGYPNQDIDHEEFRVKVTQWVEDFKDDDLKHINRLLDHVNDTDVVSIPQDVDNEWIFRKLAEFKDGRFSIEELFSILWHMPENPYGENGLSLEEIKVMIDKKESK